MSKTKNEEVNEPIVDNPTKEAVESGSPAFLEELMKNGTTVLKAPSREDIEAILATIPADIKYMVGAVGQCSEDFTFTLRIDLT